MAHRRPRGGMRESDRLQDEALKMEAKLRALRSTMNKEREKWQSNRSANGGSLWRSSRTDRGSIRNYHNDVRKRGTRRTRGGRTGGRNARRSPRARGGGAQQSPRDAAQSDGYNGPSNTGQPVLRKKPGAEGSSNDGVRRRPRSARRLLSRADAPSWSVADVQRWLNVLSLSQYSQTFEENAINGEVLLELTTEDLDFMGIKVLGHRKMLLKGVQTLQRAARGEAPLSARRPEPQFKSEDVQLVYDSSAANNNVGTEVKGPRPDRLHWSQAKPISENKVNAAEVPVNLADGMYDEAAQRAAFQAAVMEWRNGGQAQPVNQSPAAAVNTDGMWTNPFAGTSVANGATNGASNGGDGGGKQEEPPSEAGGGKLLVGSLDEAAEHLAFEKAVEAWRMGKDMPAVKGSCYQCYKLFYKESGAFEDETKSFCSASCLTAYREAQDRVRRAQEEAASRRASIAEAEAKRQAAIAQSRSTSRLGTPLKVEETGLGDELVDALDEAHDTLARVVPAQEVDNIWAMDVQF